jgi:hypothetical protein
MTEPIFYRYPESRPEPFATWWVCECCLFTREASECGCDGNGGCEGEPWLKLDELQAESRPTDYFTVTAGLLKERHACGPEYPDECDCERREFVARSCDGCGSPLHGTRHAYTVWLEKGY